MLRMMTKRAASTRGFTRAVSLMQPRIRAAGEKRGFAVTRLVTHWAEVVGPDLAAATLPVKVGYGKGGIGATLTVLAEGARATMVEMQAPMIREKVNACYGYAAIARVRVTQTAPTGFGSGFAEGATPFAPPPRKPVPPEPGPEQRARAAEATRSVQDNALRAALTDLAANVLTKAQINRSRS